MPNIPLDGSWQEPDAPEIVRGRTVTLPGQRSSSVGLHNEEHFNIRSRKRRAWINAIDRARQHESVPAIFWAVLNVCDLETLRRIHQVCKIPKLNTPDFHSFAWNCEAFCASWGPCEAISHKRPLNDTGFMSQTTRNAARARDGFRCALTRRRGFRLACIVSEWAHGIALDQVQWSADRNVWNTIFEYWDKDKATRWIDAAYKVHGNGVLPVDNSSNLICLDYSLSAVWEKGLIAFRPLWLSQDETRLEIEFHWLIIENVNCEDYGFGGTDMLKNPLSNKGLSALSGYSWVPTIKTGDRFTLETDDPINRPLPSFDLLELSFFMNRIAAMSNATRSYSRWPSPDKTWVQGLKADRVRRRNLFPGPWPMAIFAGSNIQAALEARIQPTIPQGPRIPRPRSPSPPRRSEDDPPDPEVMFYLSWTGWKKARGLAHSDQIPLEMAWTLVNQLIVPRKRTFQLA